MPQNRSSSADSRGSSAQSAGKSSSSSGSVLSRVLGSFRRSLRDDDARANSKEDLSWANSYKITHHPDRPYQDKREGLKDRSSVYVRDQLRRMWKYNGKMTEMKRERAARKTAPATGIRRDDESRRNEGGKYGAGPGSLQTNLGRKAASQVLAGNRWQVGSEEQRYQYSSHNTPVSRVDRKEKYPSRPASSPVSVSAASDKMTIRVGLELESLDPYSEEASGGLKTRPSRAEIGGRSHVHNEVSALSPAPPSAPKFFTPLPVQSQFTSPFLSSEQKEVARRRQRSTLPHSLQQQFQAKPMIAYQADMQVSSARERALRETIPPLQTNHSNTDQQDETPSLVVISSPASEQASPETPTSDASNKGHIGHELLSTGLQTTKTCPMPLCGNPLLTAADRKQNLCAECRNDLQPRQSIFRTDVLKPVLPTYVSTKGHARLHTSLTAHVCYDSTAEVVEARVKKLPPTVRHINGENEIRTVNYGSGDRPANETRTTGTLPSSPQMNKSGNGYVLSRFNKERSEFRLQPAPFSRKHSRRGLRLGNSPTGHQTTGQKPALPLRDRRKYVDGSGHIGFQLAGWGTVTPSSAHQPLQRKPSGPLLEPKTFHPVTPSRGKNQNGSAIRRRPSGSRRRAKGALSSQRAHAEKRENHRATEPTPNALPPGRSPEHRSKQHHPEHQADGRGASVPNNPTSTDSNTQGIDEKSNPDARKTAPIDEDIYREIDSIIDCYLRLPEASESENKKRKEEAIASYFAVVPLDVEMKIKGFI